ncbi:unnamed protein product [Caenorhabditis nigoni]
MVCSANEWGQLLTKMSTTRVVPNAGPSSVNENIKVYAYETDFAGKVVKASYYTINSHAPLSKLRDMYAERYNIFPHEIDMFFDDKEVFDDDTCCKIGLRHRQIIRMQVTFDTIWTKLRDELEEEDLEREEDYVYINVDDF